MDNKVKKLSTEEITYTKNVTLRQGKYGGWFAMNVGTANATVNGYPIPPMCGLDFTHIPSDVIWDAPIVIVVQPGAAVRVTRFLYK